MTNKFIIHNHTTLEDLDVILYVSKVIQDGKISQTKNGPQYCFVTSFTSRIVVTCQKRNETYRFDVYEEE